MRYLLTFVFIALLGAPYSSLAQSLFEPKTILIDEDARRDFVLNDDFDNDGDQDLLVFRSTIDPDACCGGTYYLLYNDGAGNFTEEIILAEDIEWENIRTGDLNNDGLTDIIVYQLSDQSLRWLRNDGPQGFSTEEPIIALYAGGTFEIEDFTDDELDDILYAESDVEEQLLLLTNQGNAVFSAPTLVASGQLLRVADFDGDGQNDFFNLDDTGGVFIWQQNNGDGTFTPDTTSIVNEIPFFIPDLLVGNFGGDVTNELIVSYPIAGDEGIVTPKLYTYNESDGFALQGSLVELEVFELSPTNVAASDIDQDGDLDVLASFTFALAFSRINSDFDENVGWYENIGNFQFVPRLLTDALLKGRYIDLNNDQQLDILLSTPDELVWQENLGQGEFSPPRYLTDSRALLTASPEEGSLSISFGDLNQDMMPEMIVTEGTTNKVLYLANQDSTLNSPQLLSLNTLSPTDAVIIELESGPSEVFVLGGEAIEGRGVYRYTIQEDGSVGVKDTLYSGLLDATLFDGDFNGDGQLDLAFTDRSLSVDGEVFLLAGQADQIYEIIDSKVIGTLESVYDINGDGKTDLIIDGSIYTQTTEGNFDLIQSPEFPFNVIEDINGDGRGDLLFFSEAEVTLYLANEDGSYQEQTLTFEADYDLTAIPWLFVDVDNDQDKDLILINDTGETKELAYLQNINGTTLFGEYTVLDNFDEENIRLFSHDIDQDTDSDLIVLTDTELAWYESNARVEEPEVPTNTPPVVANPIADQQATVGEEFSLLIADSVFQDADEGDILTVTATLSDGSSLPEWLTFDASTSILGGIPLEANELTIRITATDTSDASASDDFTLVVEEATVTSLDDDVTDEIRLYPVPASETLILEGESASMSLISYRLLDIQGQVLQEQSLKAKSSLRIDVASLQRGVYLLEVQMTDYIFQRRVLIE